MTSRRSGKDKGRSIVPERVLARTTTLTIRRSYQVLAQAAETGGAPATQAGSIVPVLTTFGGSTDFTAPWAEYRITGARIQVNCIGLGTSTNGSIGGVHCAFVTGAPTTLNTIALLQECETYRFLPSSLGVQSELVMKYRPRAYESTTGESSDGWYSTNATGNAVPWYGFYYVVDSPDSAAGGGVTSATFTCTFDVQLRTGR